MDVSTPLCRLGARDRVSQLWQVSLYFSQMDVRNEANRDVGVGSRLGSIRSSEPHQDHVGDADDGRTRDFIVWRGGRSV